MILSIVDYGMVVKDITGTGIVIRNCCMVGDFKQGTVNRVHTVNGHETRDCIIDDKAKELCKKFGKAKVEDRQWRGSQQYGEFS